MAGDGKRPVVFLFFVEDTRMRHRLTLRSNPRLIVLILLLIGLPAGGLLLLIYAGLPLGILGLAAAGYLDYTMLRFLHGHARSWVETTESELTCRMPDGELFSFPWDSITLAGYCTQERGRPFLFVCDLRADKLVTIPREYGDFDALHSEIRARTPFRKLSLARGETIRDRLQNILEIEKPPGASG